MCIVSIDGKSDQSRIIKEMCELTDVLPCLIHVELLHGSLWSQDLCICHLATNLLPGYNTLFLISIGSNRTRVERLVSFGQGGVLHDVNKYCLSK